MLALFLAGCAGAELSTEELSAIKRVAIVSAVGDELSVVEIPLFPIIVEDDFGPFEEYGLDRFITNTIAQKLTPRYQVVPFDRPVRITRGDKTDWWWHDDNYTHIDLPAGGDLGNGKVVDTYIVITPGTGTVYGTSHQVHGAYLARHPNAFGAEHGVGVTYHLIVIDAKTKEKIKDIHTIAGAEVEAGVWREKYAELSDAQKRQVEAGIEHAMAVSLDNVLRAVALIPEE
ncbi:hypothetical protein DLREEDagr8_20150 [Dongia sp. agr-C8]